MAQLVDCLVYKQEYQSLDPQHPQKEPCVKADNCNLSAVLERHRRKPEAWQLANPDKSVSSLCQKDKVESKEEDININL